MTIYSREVIDEDEQIIDLCDLMYPIADEEKEHDETTQDDTMHLKRSQK